ncbi:MAG: ABC-F type ribosomal protection protein [Ruminococcaceae bacterium]|nr:ABC-F type ribosomal protection protein [Oscillospiraceae bacterium]
MSLINVQNLTFAYEGSYDNVFENVSFHIDTDWRLGFTGRNGRGKTTFLKLLMGKYEYSGHITSTVDFEYFPYPVADMTRFTMEVAEDINPDLPQWRLEKELSKLAVDEDVLWRPFETLSNGERTKVLLAVMFSKDNSFLLIDEPTNHLDHLARQQVADYLKTKKGFILVSHDRAFLDGCVDHILSINKADIEVVKGNFSTWYENKELRDRYETEKNEELKGEISRLTQAAKRASGWSDKLEDTKYHTRNGGLRPDRGYVGHKSAKMMARSKAIETRRQTAIEEKSALLKNIEEAESLKLHPKDFHSKRLVEAKDLCLYYDERKIFGPISFEINRGDRVALAGANGSGKSSLIKLLLGENISYTGQLLVAKGLDISYVSQDASNLSGTIEEFENGRGLDPVLFRAILRKLDFSRTQFEKNFEDYSQGQKKKVLIAASLCDPAHLYVWDEPMNYIDVLSRIQLEELIQKYEPTLLFVDHDRTFRENVATKIVELK